MDERNTLEFSQTDDGRVLVLIGEWVPEVLFSKQFLELASSRYITRVGNDVHIRLGNGHAQYTIVEDNYALDAYRATLVQGVKINTTDQVEI